jgi:hypothetical protein
METRQLKQERFVQDVEKELSWQNIKTDILAVNVD